MWIALCGERFGIGCDAGAKGQSNLYVLLPVTYESAKVDWGQERERFRALAIRQMERIGIHDVESRIRTERILTSNGWRDEFGLLKGSTFR